MSNQKIPLGVTCHFERIEGKWYTVWGPDFPGDESGKEEVPSTLALYLECGYEIGKSERK